MPNTLLFFSIKQTLFVLFLAYLNKFRFCVDHFDWTLFYYLLEFIYFSFAVLFTWNWVFLCIFNGFRLFLLIGIMRRKENTIHEMNVMKSNGKNVRTPIENDRNKLILNLSASRCNRKYLPSALLAHSQHNTVAYYSTVTESDLFRLVFPYCTACNALKLALLSEICLNSCKISQSNGDI